MVLGPPIPNVALTCDRYLTTGTGVHNDAMTPRRPGEQRPPRKSLLFASTCGALGLLISVVAGSWPLMVIGLVMTVGPLLNYLSQLRQHRSQIQQPDRYR
jgi:hypothetical protein